MTKRTLRMLWAVLSFLLVLWGATFLASRRRGVERTPSALTRFFQGLREGAVTAVLLQGPGDSVGLELRDGAWTANGFRTDSGAVARLWSTVREAEVGEVVAMNPSNHRRLGVSADSTWRMEYERDGDRRALLVGKEGPGSASAYVRLPGMPEVFLVQPNLRLRIALSADDWRDRRILAADTSVVARVEVDLDGRRYALVREGEGWRVDGRGAAVQATVRAVLSELANLRARDFLEPGDTIARRPGAGRVTALTGAGDTLAAVSLGAGGETLDRWARAAGDSILYRLGYPHVDRLAPDLQRILGGS